jgi:hypothetical protein
MSRTRIKVIQGLIISVIVLIAFFPYLSESGLFLPLIGDRYGRDYNDERVAQDRPIIEDYFIKEKLNDRRAHSWIAKVDSSSSNVHTGKFYYTDGFGTLLYEIDYYEPRLDDAWLLKNLNLNTDDIADIHSLELKRVHHSNKPPEYEILVRTEKNSLSTFILEKKVGDSLLSTLNGF